ncbi:MAG TPA: SRPBCC family protein [Bacteroidia bacterium]|nr:SRPBCC family protein [Bacteroidia bacterium]HNS11761.1 SRPBCC family protein [Bacteroidia bacterium]
MKILKRILIVLAVLVGLIIVIGFLSPREQHVERSTSIKASPEVVFSQINDLRKWEKWSPWIKLDPTTDLKYSEPASGAGAYYTWSSNNDQVGKGKLTITDVETNSMVRTKLDFEGMNPSTGYFKFEPEAGGTKLTWALDADMGSNPFFRVMGLMMDKMMEKPFNEGLAGIKEISEASALPEAATAVEETNTDPAE